MKGTRFSFIAVVALSGLALTCLPKADGAAPAAASRRTQRPSHWAKRIKAPGLPNFHRVSKTLYRSAQPSARGMRTLAGMGFKTVVNLRLLHSDRFKLRGTKLGYVHLRFNTANPELHEVVKFLKVATDPRRQPVLVHCKHGADRTGMMVAFYRIAVQGWSKKEAIREMTRGGFNFHSVWRNLPKYIRRADIKKIRTRAGITPPRTAAPRLARPSAR